MASVFGRAIGKLRRREEMASAIHLAAFGKHPGWDDHIEELGLDTEILIAVRRVLYLDGIAGNIDSGAWDSAEEEDLLPGYHHLFVWRFGSDLVLGRMWSSRDGKGRTRFPMIVCAHCSHIPLRVALREVLPRLEAAEQECTGTTDANDVRTIIGRHHDALLRVAAGIEPVAQPVFPSAQALARLAARPEMGPDHQGIERILYQMEREMPAFHLRTTLDAPGTQGFTFRPHHMRVPRCAESHEDAIHLWLSFLPTQIEPSAPLLLIAPVEQPWLELVVGEPSDQQLFCIRASVKRIPLATEIPYTLDEAFVQQVERDIEASRAGTLAVPESRADAPAVAARAAPAMAEPAPLAAPRPRRSLGELVRRLWWVPLLVALIAALVLATPTIVKLLQLPEEVNKGLQTWEGADAEAWHELCTAYNGWFARFLSEARGARLARWRQDPELARLVVARIEGAQAIVTDPRRIARREGVPVEDLAQRPPEAARMPDAVARTRKALDAVRAVEEGIAQWPAAGDSGLAVMATRYADERGWTRQAEQLRTVAASVRATHGTSVAGAIDAALAAKAQLRGIEDRFAAIESHLATLALLGADLAAQAREQALARTRSTTTVAMLGTRLTEVESEAARIAATVEPIRVHQREIASVAGEGFARRFVECIKPPAAEADPLKALPARLKAVKGLAPGVVSRLKEIQAHHDAILDLGDKALAERLWACALAETEGATNLMALNERLESVKATAPKIARLRKTIAGHHQAVMGLGIATLERHGRHVAASIADAKDLTSLLAGLQRSADLIAGVAARWREIDKLAKSIAASGDKILAQFGRYPPARVNAENNIATLPATLDEIKTTAQQLADLVERDWQTGRIDRERFTRESAVHRTFDGHVTDQTLQDWRTEVASYYRLASDADPRQPRDLWDRPIQDVRWRIQFLLDSRDPARKRLGEEHTGRLKELERQLEALRELPWIKDNQSRITETAAGLRKDLTALQAAVKDVIEPPAEWLARVRGLGRIADSPAINREWVKRRSDLVTDKVTARALEGFRQVYARLWRHVRSVREFLAGLDDRGAMPRGLPEAVGKLPQSPVVRAVAQAAEARREQAIEQVLAAVRWTDEKTPAVGLAELKQEKAWKEACTAYAAWRRDAGKLVADLHTVEAGTAAAYLLDDKPPGASGTIRQLYARWRKHELMAELRGPLQPVISRIDELEALADLDRDGLVGRLAEPASPAVTLAIWQRLGARDGWPSTLAELKLEQRARQTLSKALAAIRDKDAARGQWLEAQLAAEGPRRWERALHAVAAKTGEDLRDPGLAGVLELAKPFGAAAERLSAVARLRIRLRGLRDGAGGLPEKAPKASVVRLVDGFRRDVAAIPQIAGAPQVAALLEQLEQIREMRDDDRPGAGLAKAGPMASSLAGEWKARVLDDGSAAVFTWGSKGHTLRFVRVEPPGGATPAYVGTTEVSVGLFIDVMSAAERWGEAKALLRKYDPKHESLKGPRVWEWRDEAGGVIRLPRRWLSREMGRGQHYAEGLAPGAPQRDHPMQYISAAGALYVARMLACRLPSPTEWRAASDAAGRPATPNLRDAAWRKQQEHVRKKWAAHIPADWPDAGIFWPLGVERREGDDAAIVAAEDDGALWFQPVGEPGALRHLVGNVAEFVLDHPERWAQRFPDGKRLEAEAVVAYLKQHGADVAVVGGSALSPPTLWDGRDKPFSKPWPVPAPDSRDGYSDVGFRLAFAAPRETAAARLQRVLRSVGYLPALQP